MKSSFLCIGLLALVLLVTAGCAPITTSMPLANAAGDTRGGANPTDPVSPLPTPPPTATDPVSPLPTPTPTATDPVSPLAQPTLGQSAQGNANAGGAPVSVTHVVRRGDTLAKIAAAFGVSTRAILNANPTIKSADVIFAGQRLNIPAPSRSPNATPQG